MKLCNADCIPCCDFCKYVIHDTYEEGDNIITLGPIGCNLWDDEVHQHIAEECGYCNDFDCVNS